MWRTARVCSRLRTWWQTRWRWWRPFHATCHNTYITYICADYKTGLNGLHSLLYCTVPYRTVLLLLLPFYDHYTGQPQLAGTLIQEPEHVGPGYYLDGWPSLGRYTISACNNPTRSTQPCIPPGSLNQVPTSAGVKAGMSPLSGGS